ncbi:hypothetical protein [Janthinobacterium sp. 17J80-10]|uniref:hypothetical protein n=1 Tax=Janthinobacterium sp. 17J80-10 TaxID=2497863 RepID=UPI0010053744|nr:hypothetical protein [Janthinobacterium sp. 17J80-10]QAU32835.1 hypothetical protein EKL02_00855 [Janthinobacterium sp. 17J80-10]
MPPPSETGRALPAYCLLRCCARIFGKTARGAIGRAPAGTITTAEPPLAAGGAAACAGAGEAADCCAGADGMAGAGGTAALRAGWDSSDAATAGALGGMRGSGGEADVDADDGGEVGLSGVGCGDITAPPLAGFAPPGKLPPPERWATPAGAESRNTCASMIGAA